MYTGRYKMGYVDSTLNTVGPTTEHHMKMKVYSEIWGIDPETEKPREFNVDVDILIMGRWGFLYCGGCVQPAAPRRYFDQTIKEGRNPGDEIFEWDDVPSSMRVGSQWDDDEITGFPDRIYFSATLPDSMRSIDCGAREFPITLQTIDSGYINAPDGKLQSAFGCEKQSPGVLTISDTGAMEISGDYNFPAYHAYMLENKTWFRNAFVVYKSNCIDCGNVSRVDTKPGKVAGNLETGYWIGFMPFTVMIHLDGFSLVESLVDGTIEEDDIPDVNTPRSYITKSGVDLRRGEKEIERLNKLPEMQLKLQIVHYRNILTKMKNYYQSLSEEHKKDQVIDDLKAAVEDIKTNHWSDIEKHLKLSDYLPAAIISPPDDENQEEEDNNEGMDLEE